MEHSAGIIPFRFNDKNEMEFFVGHPGGQVQNYWAFLKGCQKKGETFKETAIREFKEETGLDFYDVTFENLIPLGSVQQNKHKTAIAFGLYYPDIMPNECHSNLCENGVTPEIDRYSWFTFDELKKVTHPMHISFYEQLLNITEI